MSDQSKYIETPNINILDHENKITFVQNERTFELGHIINFRKQEYIITQITESYERYSLTKLNRKKKQFVYEALEKSMFKKYDPFNL